MFLRVLLSEISILAEGLKVPQLRHGDVHLQSMKSLRERSPRGQSAGASESLESRLSFQLSSSLLDLPPD